MYGVTGGAGIYNNRALGSIRITTVGGVDYLKGAIVGHPIADPAGPDFSARILTPRRVSETQKNNFAESGRFTHFPISETNRLVQRTKPVRSSWR